MFDFFKKSDIAANQHPLPDYAKLYFDYLISEYDHLALSFTNENKDFQQYGQSLKEKEAHLESLSWNDLFSLELLIAKILPKERLLREVWRLRLRYRDVVGLKQYENYLASKPPDLAPEKLNENDYRADIEYLLTEIYLRYLTTPYNEALRNKISRKVTWMILGGLVIIIGAACLFSYIIQEGKNLALGPTTFLLVMFLGAMGGLLSMQQRYQNISRDGDPVDNMFLLNQGWSRLFVPAISGAIFAAVLYMILGGNLVQGDLFPKITTSKNLDATNDSNLLLNTLNDARPITAADYAKLVVWSFLAGFAERFVPDTLSRFTNANEAKSK
jgi:hypothetical protein